VFEGLAKVIMKRPKQIILIWVAMLLISTPFIYQVIADPGSVLKYDMTTMVGEGSESVRGLEIINDSNYFYHNETGTQLILVIDCNSESDLNTNVPAFVSSLKTELSDRYGDSVSTVPLGFYSKSGTYPGIYLESISFTDGRDVGDEVDNLRSIISDAKSESGSSLTTYLTGSSAIGHDTEVGAVSDVKRIDPFSIILVLVLIGLFFRSLITAATPPITIGFAYGIVMTVICAIAQFMDIYYITSTIVLVSMLGAGCDYCIFIIARYREERKDGKDHEAALRESITWAGESITISGMSVIIGFGVLSLCSFSMISTMGIVLASGIVFALLAALTLIPSILAVIGDRIFYPSNMETYKDDSKAMHGWYGKFSRFGKRYFEKSSHFSINHAVAIVAAAIVITVPLAYVTLSENTSYDMISVMPSGEAKNGVDEIVNNADGGMIMPTYVLLKTDVQIADIKDGAITLGTSKLGVVIWADDPNGTATAANMIQTKMYMGLTTNTSTDGSLAKLIMTETAGSSGNSNVSEIEGIVSWKILLDSCGGDINTALSYLPSYARAYIEPIATMDSATWNYATGGTYAQAQAIDYILNYSAGSLSKPVDGTQYIKITVVTSDQPMSDLSMKTISQIKSATSNFMSGTYGSMLFSASYVTGSAVAIYDISQIVNNEFDWIEIAVIVLIFLLLFAVMRAYLTPVRSLVTIIMSISWTLGMTHLIFTHWLGIPVTWIVPIVLFVICLGLGMDYDILLTTRIKENVSKGMSNDDAIIHAVEKTGAVITVCGLIMSGAFGTMMLSTSPMLAEFGFALGFAILVDALVVRTYIVPAVMHLMGRWNWVGPKWMSFMKLPHKQE
jgi:RND superfamily putative drug exporter